MKHRFLASALLALSAIAVAPHAAAAELNGKWMFAIHTDGGDRSFSPVFKLDGETVTGKWGASDVKGSLTGNKLELNFPFVSEEPVLSGTLHVTGTLADNKLTGNWQFDSYQGTFDAVRDTSSAPAAVIASPLSGNWQCTMEVDRVYNFVLNLREEAGVWKGKVVSDRGELPLQSVKVAQDAASFSIDVDSTVVAFKVKARADRVEGTWSMGDSSGPLTGVKKSE